MAFFSNLLQTLPRPVKILDVGGTETYWEILEMAGNPEFQITLLNLKEVDVHFPNLSSVVGDATAMGEFGDQSFDVVYSNSVIEHVGNLDRQRKMANEIMRIGKNFFVQTPNLYFPIEPHFVFPCFQFLPVSVRVFLLQRFKLGWIPKTPDKKKAEELVREVRLMTRKELLQVFPGRSLEAEKFMGMVKSWMVYSGFEAQ